jgi:hypothetical protein
MRREFTDIESIIQDAVKGWLDPDARDAFYAFCTSQGLKFKDVCNTIAVTVAKRFNDSAMTFDDADGVMNALSGLMLGHAHVVESADPGLPEPAWSIFLAFDAGEYDHGDGADPIERFTRPLVRDALRDA